jgi:hypothetical protein
MRLNMTDMVLDDGMAAQLQRADKYVRLRDASGRVLGYFLPADPNATVVIYGAKSPHSPEELERRYREGAAKARPLSEFWDEMRQKYPDQFQ